MAARPEPPLAEPPGGCGARDQAQPGRHRQRRLTFLDREGWDALTINALATQLGTKGPSLYNHVHSLDDLRRTVRMRVVGDIIGMLNTVGEGRTRDDAVVSHGQRLPQLRASPPGPVFGVHPDAAGRRRRPGVHRRLRVPPQSR